MDMRLLARTIVILSLSGSLSAAVIPAELVFDGTRAEHTFMIKDLDPCMPQDWSDFRYLVMELKTSSPQRFSIWIQTQSGGRRLMFHPFGQDVWLRACIPLEFFTGKGREGVDLAAAHNKRFDSFWVGLWGPFGDLKDVNAISLVMDYPVNRPKVQIRSIYLAKDDQGSRFLEQGPFVDEFGQFVRADWPRKVRSREQLYNELSQEAKGLGDASRFNYCQYGGYMQTQLKGTGFFRLEQVDGRWWFVDPDGHLFLSIGSNCVSDRSDPTLPIRRMISWGMNTIGNWSMVQPRQGRRMAYTIQFRTPRFIPTHLGMPDVYADGFEQAIDDAAQRQCASNKTDQWLLGYFLGNEPAWPGRESELIELFLKGPECETQRRIRQYLADGDSLQRRQAFVYRMFERYLNLMINAIRKADPNHLILGIRFGGTPPDQVLRLARSFDVCSINVYEYEPTSQIKRVYQVTGRPVLIGEFHIGVPANGLAAGLVQAADQYQRAKGYRYYIEQAAGLPAFVGAHWFQWADEPVLGRMDGENYNIGLVDVTNRPYPELVEAAITTHARLYDVHAGKARPFDQRPKASEHGTPESPW